MFRVKICGITQPDVAAFVVEAGADAVGLNFYPKSPRCVSVDAARLITEQVIGPGGVLPVGLFVNMPAEEVGSVVQSTLLAAVQISGDEPADFLSELARHLNPPHPVFIRTRRLDDRGVDAIAKDLRDCAAAGQTPHAVLVDAMVAGRYGGTGKTVCWPELADYRRHLGDVPLILAGGLTPENVAEAIRTVRPSGVDTASGVESSPGVKDPHKVRDFVQAALGAFQEVNV